MGQKNTSRSKIAKEVDGRNDSSNVACHAKTVNDSINPKSVPKKRKTPKPKTTKQVSVSVVVATAVATNNSSKDNLDYDNVPSAAQDSKQALPSLSAKELCSIQNITHIIVKSNNQQPTHTTIQIETYKQPTAVKTKTEASTHRLP